MRAFATIVAATAATILVVTLANGSSQSNYEQAQQLVKRATTLEAEAKALKGEAVALETALRPEAPKEEPPPTGKEQTTWAAASTGQIPLTDAQAAAAVVHKPETRPANATANSYLPTETEVAAFKAKKNPSGQTVVQYNRLQGYVSGQSHLSNPSTDDLIQWGAAKWGVPVDWLRAEYVQESNWNQSGVGDFRSGTEVCGQPSYAFANNGTYTSLGITQVKHYCNESQGTGSEPLRWKSTAFNIDYQLANVRYYFDGLCSWCGTGYSAGQQWPSIGAWFSPSPWNNSGAVDYQNKVKAILAEQRWAKAGF